MKPDQVIHHARLAYSLYRRRKLRAARERLQLAKLALEILIADLDAEIDGE